MAKVGFTIKLSEKQIEQMMRLTDDGLYGESRAEIASNLILDQLKRLEARRGAKPAIPSGNSD